MSYKVRMWIENGNVLCCSSVCTNVLSGQICPRVDVCKQTTIEEVESGDKETYNAD